MLATVGVRLRQPLWCNEVPVMVTASYGLSPFRLGEVKPEDVLRTAISAANDAQEAGLEYAVYSPATDKANRRRYTLLTDMRAALDASDQLSLVYQPRVDARTGAYVSAEALLRWHHPVLGPVSPGEFIPLIEQTALARPVTAWVIGAALDQALAWRRFGCPLRISVNVSAHNLEEEDFASRLAAALELRALAPDAVELEFTESALIRNGERVMAQLKTIRAMGVEIAIDDFGTGYSTFAYLKAMPASTVKLDQSFIRNVVDNPRDQLLVSSMISMAHGLGYRTVAEGVETAEVRSFLSKAGCDELQGYLISRPVPAVILQSLLTHSKAA